MRTICLTILMVGAAGSAWSAPGLFVSAPYNLTLHADPDAPPSAAERNTLFVAISDMAGLETIKVRYVGVRQFVPPTPANPDDSPRLITVSPAEFTLTGAGGANGQTVRIGLNASEVKKAKVGNFALDVIFSTVGLTPEATGSAWLAIKISGGTPEISSVVHGASFQPVIAPGSIFTIFGTRLSRDLGAQSYDDTAAYPVALDADSVFGTVVTVNGTPAAILYASPGQINAIAPYGIAGAASAEVMVTRGSHSSSKFTVPVQTTAPGVFTAGGNGTGQGAILTVRQSPRSGTSPNSAADPADRGDAIAFWITGAGAWDPPLPDGIVSLELTSPFCGYQPCYKPVAAPISLTIGGRPATIVYSGATPYMPWAVMQVNAVIPDDAPSGDQPLVIKVGGNDNALQRVTVAIR